jgi:hypothetical protein
VLHIQRKYSTRRVWRRRTAYIIGVLRLKSAVGTLSVDDLEEINRQLKG